MKDDVHDNCKRWGSLSYAFIRRVFLLSLMLAMLCSVSVVAAKLLPPSPYEYEVQFNQSSYVVDENMLFVTLNLTLNKTYGNNISMQVFYNTRNGTANNVTNFESPVNSTYPETAKGVYVEFFPGNLSHLINIPIKDDGLYSSPDKFFFMNLTYTCCPCWSVYGPNRNVTITIKEASPKPVVQFDPSSYTVGEDGGSATLNVTLSNPASDPVIVNYRTTDGTAVDGTNYTGTSSGTVTVPAGKINASIDVPIFNDDVIGGDTFFFVNLTGASSNADLGSQKDATVTVLEDDGELFTVALYKGWNMISCPLVVEPFMVSELNTMNPLINRVMRYNNSTLQYDPWMVGAPPEFDFGFYTDAGYFVYCEDDTQITFVGVNPAGRSTLLKNTWNMIGWSTFESSDAKSVCDMLPGSQRVLMYDAMSQAYKPYMEGAPDEFNFVMGPGSGYLIYSDAETSLDYGGI